MKKLILTFALIILLVYTVSAIDTEITIKTLPNHLVQLTTSKANQIDYQAIQYLKETSDENGDVTFTASTDDAKFNIIIYLKDLDGETVSAKNLTNPVKINNHASGEPLTLNMYPDWYTPPAEITTENIDETNSTEETQNLSSTQTESSQENTDAEKTSTEENNTTDNSPTGLAISEKSLSGKTFYYGVGILGFLLVSFGIFIIARKTKSRKKMKGMEKLDDILDQMDSKGKKSKNKKDLMEDVKKKIKEVESEIEEIKD